MTLRWRSELTGSEVHEADRQSVTYLWTIESMLPGHEGDITSPQ